MTSYEKQSLTLLGALSMGTGVMIGAGNFALTGQIAELAGPLFPVAFVLAAVIATFGSYSYVKMSQAYPSAGGIAMFLQKAYGKGLITAFCALLMYLSMVINESPVALAVGMNLTRTDVGANSSILATAIVLDTVVLVAFVLVKLQRDPLVVAVALISMLLILGSEALFVRLRRSGS